MLFVPELQVLSPTLLFILSFDYDPYKPSVMRTAFFVKKILQGAYFLLLFVLYYNVVYYSARKEREHA